MKKIRWIIQENDYSSEDVTQINRACDKIGVPYVNIKVIPFTNELPDFPVDDEYENIYYGGITMIDLLIRDYNSPKGVFMDRETFSMENYVGRWGEHMLSSDAEFMTFQEFVDRDYPENQTFFIRPDADNKSFAGQVLMFGEIESWYSNLLKDDVYGLGPDTKIMIGPAYNIRKEWRNYIVNGKVVTSSMYRKDFRLHEDGKDIPEEMINFVEDRCAEYQPHDVFAMDIAEVLDDGKPKYYIIECGGLNSVGFYHCDIDKFVGSLTDYLANKSLTVGA